ncbi:MAG: glycosyltransferase family 2 protein [Bacteroidetes bacterium]|nr:glycosyltransferase family 2 protein [Bacteroidota bacterium]
MKVSGFTFVRNAVKFDYPVVEGIKSILPICDEVVVAVGNSEDDTLGLIKSIGTPKIKIIETIWDNSQREGGRVYAIETEKALRACNPESDWRFYMQADEVFHENDLPLIHKAMLKWKEDKQVDGLVFDHINFYCTYKYYADARHWQKKEIRVIRNNHQIRSYGDAASFRMANGRKLHCKYVPAMIYHYGWVREPYSMQQKKIEQNSFHAETIDKNILPGAVSFDYSGVATVSLFSGTHPQEMHERMKRCTWDLDINKIKRNDSIRRRILDFIYKKTGWNIGGHKNYKLIS